MVAARACYFCPAALCFRVTRCGSPSLDQLEAQLSHPMPTLCAQIILIELEKAELNKYMATVEGWDTDSKRYEVCLHADKRTLKLQPKNVLLPVCARVCVDGLQGAPHHNGTLARVRDYDAVSGRYEVGYINKSSGEMAALKLKRENVLQVVPQS